MFTFGVIYLVVNKLITRKTQSILYFISNFDIFKKFSHQNLDT